MNLDSKYFLSALFLLAIFFALDSLPDSYGLHTTNSTSGLPYTDTWVVKEIDDNFGECDIVAYGNYQFNVRTDNTGTSQYCSIFKVFDNNDLDGKLIQHYYQSGSRYWFQQSGNPSCWYTYVQIRDGGYDETSSTWFPTDQFPVFGSGVMYNDANNKAYPDSSFTPNLSSSQLQDSTLFMIIYDCDTTDDYVYLAVNTISIEDLGTFDFCQGNAADDCVAQRPLDGPYGSAPLRYWYITTMNPIFQTDAVVNDFDVTVINKTAVTFDWTTPTQTADATHDLPITQFFLEFKNGTNNESDGWTYLTTVDDLVNSYTANIFEAGHNYTARIITIGDNDWYSNPSTEVTFQMNDDRLNDATFVSEKSLGANTLKSSYWSPDGKNYYTLDATSDHIEWWETTTAFNKTGLTLSGTKTTTNTPKSFYWCQSGLRYFTFEYNGATDYLRTYTTPTAWQITSATLENTKWPTAADYGPILINPSETKMWSMDDATDDLAEWDMPNGCSPTGMTSSPNRYVVDYFGTGNHVAQIHFADEGKTIYYVGIVGSGINDIDSVRKGSLATAYEFDATNDILHTEILQATTLDAVNGFWCVDGCKDGTNILLNGDIGSSYGIGEYTLTSGTINPQTYDTIYEQYGVENRWYFREHAMEAMSSQSNHLSANCDEVAYDGTNGVFFNTENQGHAATSCFIFKVLPATALNNTWTLLNPTWEFTQNSGAAYVSVYEGAMDVYNSTHFPHDSRFYRGGDYLSQTISATGEYTQGRLYHNGGISVSPATTFNVTGTTNENFITMVISLDDQWISAGDETGVTLEGLKIEEYDGTDLYTFLLPNTTSIQNANPIVFYGRQTAGSSGSESDWGWVNSVFPPNPPVLTLNYNQEINGNTVPLSWTDTHDPDFAPISDYDVKRKCDLESSFTTLTNILYGTFTYNDNTFSGYDSCDYKITANGTYGSSDSNTETATYTSTAVCSEETTNSFLLTWEATTTSEDLQGYGVQISEDNSIFSNVIVNTVDTDPSWRLTGLTSDTGYYVQWRNVFFNGTYGDWSGSTQCNTLPPSGGGGTPTPDPDPDPPCPDLNFNGICDDEEGCVDLNNNGICDYLEESPFTGISLEAPPKTMSVADEQEGFLIVNWVGTTPLTISDIAIDTSSAGLSLAFATPITFQPDPLGETTSRIPYTITSAPEECVTVQTPNCVFVDATYEVPISIKAYDNLGELRAGAILEVDIVSGFEVAQLMALGLGVLAFAGIVARRRRKDNSRTRRKAIKSKPKTNFRPKNQRKNQRK